MKKITKNHILIVNHLLKLYIILFAILMSGFIILVVFFKVDLTATATGIVKTKKWIDVKPEIPGIIKEVKVTEGRKVKKGDVLFSLENREREIDVEKARLKITELTNHIHKLQKEIRLSEELIPLEISEAKANLDSLEIKYKSVKRGARLEEIKLAENKKHLALLSLEKAQAKAERIRKARTLKMATQQDLDNAEFEIKLSKANLNEAINELKLLRNKYDKFQIDMVKAELEGARAIYKKALFQKKRPEIMQIDLQSAIRAREKEEKQLKVMQTLAQLTHVRSPINGYVLTHDVEHLVGQAVQAGQAVIRIGDGKELILETKVSEVDIPLIRVGQKARVQIKPFPKGEYRLFDAEVTVVGEDLKKMDMPADMSVMSKLKMASMGSGLLQNPLALESMKQSYFPVILTIEKPYTMSLYGNSYRIRPGYSAEVKIITQQERILTFLLRRVLRIKGEIASEKIHL